MISIPLFCRRSLLVRPNGSAVDHLDVAIVGSGDGIHHPVPHACFAPAHEAIIAGRARPISLRQIARWRTGTKHPEDSVQHAAIINARHASRFVGQQGLDHAPLEVGQIISAHADAESEFGTIRKLSVGISRYDLTRSEEHTSELQSLTNLVCRLLLEKKKINKN